MADRLPCGLAAVLGLMLTLATVLLPACGGAAARGAIDDAAITARIKTLLLNDAAIAGTRIDVDTAGGIVTMSGTVTSASEEQRAIQLVRGVDGVRDVRSVVQIAPGRP